MGMTGLSRVECSRLIDLLEREWPVVAYDVINFNCCHFSDEFCMRLGVGGVPYWVMNLAGVGAAVERNTGDFLNPQCCRIMAGETSGMCMRDGEKSWCKFSRVHEPEEADGEVIVHYLIDAQGIPPA
eukprot:CAMPEP_0198503816 /NCGR_PEP_ID=MMETSP1462-20131121/10124_1 /TAXON_ID=1333877 /ORGANISM="Brandtodinium nutriculum, Strain RCC3387" /LENGTH=126 /DNA_ID=CAMNT_0044232953 /DNA_START=362 /DNA_END=740 /DNA_ORIENTATION=+